jgi:hypothetical protein
LGWRHKSRLPRMTHFQLLRNPEQCCFAEYILFQPFSPPIFPQGRGYRKPWRKVSELFLGATSIWSYTAENEALAEPRSPNYVTSSQRQVGSAGMPSGRSLRQITRGPLLAIHDERNASKRPRHVVLSGYRPAQDSLSISSRPFRTRAIPVRHARYTSWMDVTVGLELGIDLTTARRISL